MPPGYDPHVVAASLVALLAALPEPLLTHSRYEAFISAGSLDSIEGVPPGASAANLRNLVMALPYSHKAVLVRVGRLLHACCCGPDPQVAKANGTSAFVLGLVFAPAILRPRGLASSSSSSSSASSSSPSAAGSRAKRSPHKIAGGQGG